MTTTSTESATASRQPATSKRRVRTELGRVSLIFAWIVIIVIFGILRPDTFLSAGNAGTILGSDAVLVVLTLGLLLPLRAGDFDLSIAGTLTLSAMMVGILNGEHHVNIWLVAVLALIMGLAVGAFNGLFVLLFGINSFIVTLGMGTLLAGIVLLVSNSRTYAGISQGLVDAVVGNRLWGIPLEFYYGLAMCVVIWYVIDLTSFGRRLLFVGTGREVARLSGIKVGRARLIALMGAGLLAALAGILYAGTSGSADPTSGTSMLLPAFAAAFLGATTITPGRFNAWGTIIAVYFLGTGVNGLAIIGLGSWVQEVFYGGALIVAVALSQLARRRQQQEIA